MPKTQLHMLEPNAPWPTFDAVIYDLDGTLLDTLADLAQSANAVLRQFGFAEHPEDAYRYFIGDGVRELIRRCLPEAQRADEDLIDRGVKSMAERYARQWHVRTRIYPGAAELVLRVSAAGLPQAVLSNKPDVFTRKMTDYYFPQHPFAQVLGQTEDRPKKPDPAGALWLARQLDLPPAKILYLGDTGTDMQTAVAAGMFPVGACWGFRPREELCAQGARALAEHPDAVAEALGLSTPARA